MRNNIRLVTMCDYPNGTYSVLHNAGETAKVGERALVSFKTKHHHKDSGLNTLKITEVIETRPHKTDATKEISIVRFMNQIDEQK